MTKLDTEVLTTLEASSLATGACLVNVEEILSIIFLVISILLGIVNFIMMIKRFYADGKIDDSEKIELEREINNLRNQLNEATNQLKEKSNDKNNRST